MTNGHNWMTRRHNWLQRDIIEWQADIIEWQTGIIEWQADIIESAQWMVFLIWKLLHTIAASCDRRLHRVSL